MLRLKLGKEEARNGINICLIIFTVIRTIPYVGYKRIPTIIKQTCCGHATASRYPVTFILVFLSLRLGYPGPYKSFIHFLRQTSLMAVIATAILSEVAT